MTKMQLLELLADVPDDAEVSLDGSGSTWPLGAVVVEDPSYEGGPVQVLLQ